MVMLVTFVTMASLSGLGAAAGRLIAWCKEQRYLKVLEVIKDEDD